MQYVKISHLKEMYCTTVITNKSYYPFRKVFFKKISGTFCRIKLNLKLISTVNIPARLYNCYLFIIDNFFYRFVDKLG